MRLNLLPKIVIIFIALYFIPAVLMSSDDVKKADKYYHSLNYKYALEIYLSVMGKHPSAQVAEKIANCYRYMNNSEAAEEWYLKVVQYQDINSDNFKYLAEVLKQNGKFEDAAKNFKIWGEKSAVNKVEAEAKSNACMVAKIWIDNPDIGSKIENAKDLNSENSDFCPSQLGSNILFVSDRWFLQNADKKSKKKDVSGWTGNPYYKVYMLSTSDNSTTLLDKIINNNFHNGPVVANTSADTLYFTRSELPEKRTKIAQSGRKYIYQVVKSENKWVSAVRLPFNVNKNFSVQHPALSPNGNILYFASDMPGGYGGNDIYYTEKQADGSWTAPKNCGAEINTPEDDVFPYVRNDGKFYFSSKGHVGMGGLDVFTANGEKGNFNSAENLRSPLNSPKDDFGVLFNADNTTGYISSNRSGSIGLDDIYKFTSGIEVKKNTAPIYTLNGSIIDKISGQPLSGIEIILFNRNTSAEAKQFSDANGQFNFNLEKATDYIVRGNLTKFYTSQEASISTKGNNESTAYTVKFELEKSKDLFTITLNNIYYNFNKWDIRNDAVAGLQKINAFMASMPNVNLELVAHTDSRGKADYNLELSKKRAESAKKFLTSEGVNQNRLTTVGKGETALINKCADGVKCSQEEHQANRRTEFKIKKEEPLATIKNKKNTFVINK